MWRWFRWILLGTVIIALCLSSYALYRIFSDKNITDFSSCTKKYPVMLTYPAQCRTKDGRTFTEPSSGEFKKTAISEEIQEEIKTTYYDISGSSKAELNAQMSELGPDCGEVQNCFAYTSWAVDWTYPIVKENSCEPVSATVSIEYTLPRWVNKEQASQSLQNDWEVYYRKLKAHEENHYKIALKYAQQFQYQLLLINQAEYHSCRELEDKISEYHATGKIINACAAEQKSYDDRTNHGATEGIAL